MKIEYRLEFYNTLEAPRLDQYHGGAYHYSQARKGHK